MSEFESPPRKWSILAVVGGIITAIAVIIGLEAWSNQWSETVSENPSETTEVSPEGIATELGIPPSIASNLDQQDLQTLKMDLAMTKLPGTPVPAEALTSADTPNISASSGELTEEKLEMARQAWAYFEENWNEKTGLVNSVTDFPAVTLWDQAAGMAGLVSAYELGIVPKAEFEAKMTQALKTLAKLPLYNDELPNKVYNAQTLIPVAYGELETEQEIGWSAIDIGRMAIWLKIIGAKYPQFAKATEAVWNSWDVERLTKDGQMYGTSVVDDEEQYNQEGRLGYENYAAYGLKLWGLDVENAVDPIPEAQFVNLYGVGVPFDKRDYEVSGAHNYVLTEPFILDGIETGFSGLPKAYSDRILAAQEARYNETGILTAVTEDNLDREPYFVYNSLFVDGKPWATITDTGKSYNHLTFLSAKASVGLHALYNTEYTEKLFNFVQENLKSENGWYNGYYTYLDELNDVLTANNNGVILESLLYEKVGQPLTVWAGVEQPK